MHVGGRLIARSTLEANPDGFISAIQGVLVHGAAFSGFSMNVNRAHDSVSTINAANPAWQKAAVSAVLGM